MAVKFFEITSEFVSYFPIEIDNTKVELFTGVDDKKYVSEDCLNWRLFLDKFNKDLPRKEQLLPLYNHVLNSDALSVEIKMDIIDIMT